MTGNWVLKVYKKENKTTAIKKILKKGWKEQDRYFVCTYIDKPKKEMRQLRRIGVKFSCYPVEYERSGNYRKVFFERTKGPYRCRYCNKILDKKHLFVDHIVPVAQSQKKKSARLMLSIGQCRSVNDIRNLAPACKTCNLKKSDKMGLWVIRGYLGKYRFYWFSLKFAQAAICCLALFGLFEIFKAML